MKLWQAAIKRLIDVVLGLAALVLLLRVMALVAVAAALPRGAVLATWLTIRAPSCPLAVNPYVPPHYLLGVPLEIDPRRSRADANPEFRAL
jgi:hypothetical protein